MIDNGWGFEKGTEDTGYAMKNLKERLEIAFGEPYGLLVLEPESGALVRLILPLFGSPINMEKSGEHS